MPNALEYQMQVFGRAGVPDYDIIRSIADYFLDYPDTCHHPKEDFRRLRERCAQDAAAIDELMGEHREMHGRARSFRDTVRALLSESDIARDAVVDAALVFIETERCHMAKEEERFFPLAESRLTPEDWSRIEDELADRRDPLFGDRVEEEFRGLRERLLAWEREYRKDEPMVANPDSSTAAERVELRRSHREEGGWELFAHGSDIGVRGFGKARETAFEEAAYALTSVITDAGAVESQETVDVVCDARTTTCCSMSGLTR